MAAVDLLSCCRLLSSSSCKELKATKLRTQLASGSTTEINRGCTYIQLKNIRSCDKTTVAPVIQIFFSVCRPQRCFYSAGLQARPHVSTLQFSSFAENIATIFFCKKKVPRLQKQRCVCRGPTTGQHPFWQQVINTIVHCQCQWQKKMLLRVLCWLKLADFSWEDHQYRTLFACWLLYIISFLWRLYFLVTASLRLLGKSSFLAF